ncbi:MAG: hypothetical protein FVQ77_01975 [Cytophagales bacterium]|nr:hypothetical protein [Cytophagales bacterium]
MNAKKSTFIFIVLALFSFKIYAQKIDSLIAYKKKLTLGFYFLPGISTINRIATKYKPFVKDNYSRISFNGGLEIKTELKEDRFYLQSGVFLFDRGYKINFVYTDSSGIPAGELKSSEVQYYLGIPISFIVKYRLFYGGIGITFNYFIKRKFIVNKVVISTESPDYLVTKFLVGILLKLGIEKEINDKLSISWELYVSPTFKKRFMNYGIGLGVNYKLNN